MKCTLKNRLHQNQQKILKIKGSKLKKKNKNMMTMKMIVIAMMMFLCLDAL